jgi:hypothetical protein
MDRMGRSETSVPTRVLGGRAPSVYDLNGKQGTELAEVIVEKNKSAVNSITFK